MPVARRYHKKFFGENKFLVELPSNYYEIPLTYGKFP